MSTLEFNDENQNEILAIKMNRQKSQNAESALTKAIIVLGLAKDRSQATKVMFIILAITITTTLIIFFKPTHRIIKPDPSDIVYPQHDE